MTRHRLTVLLHRSMLMPVLVMIKGGTLHGLFDGALCIMNPRFMYKIL